MTDHRIPAVERTIEVLDALADNPYATISDLAARLPIPRSTIYRILNSLEAHAIVVKDADARYALGPRLVRLARAVNVGVDLIGIAKPHMDQLAARLGSSVKLSVLDNGTALVIAVSESPQTYSVTTQVGRRFPLHAGAASKVLLAHADPALVTGIWSKPLERISSATITDRHVLRAELEEIRRLGFAGDRGEYAEGVHAFASPVLDDRRVCVGAISVPFVATDTATATAIRDGVSETAGLISRQLGLVVERMGADLG